MSDHYKTLGLSQTATQDEIKKAYRKLAKRFHPDANPGNKSAEESFKKIGEAYGVLSDETQKADYDKKFFASDSDFSGYNFGKTQNQSNGRSSPHMSESDFLRTNGVFKDFFGFNPKDSSTEMNKDKNVKPMKTKDAFEEIFGKNRFKF